MKKFTYLTLTLFFLSPPANLGNPGIAFAKTIPPTYSESGNMALVTGLVPKGYGYGSRNVLSIAFSNGELIGTITNRRGFPICQIFGYYDEECRMLSGCEPLGMLLSGCD